MREISIGLGIGIAAGAAWKVIHSADRRRWAEADRKWIVRKEELRARSAAAAKTA